MVVGCDRRAKLPERIEGAEVLKNFGLRFDFNIRQDGVTDLKAIQLNPRGDLITVLIRISTVNARKWVSENMPELYANGFDVGGDRYWVGIVPLGRDVPWWDGSRFKEEWFAFHSEILEYGHISMTISQDKSGLEIIHIWSCWSLDSDW